MFSVYILKSSKYDRHYIGYSQNPEKRLQQHNNGDVRSTKAYRPYEIIFTEEHLTRSKAMKREKELKKMKSGVQFKNIIAT